MTKSESSPADRSHSAVTSLRVSVDSMAAADSAAAAAMALSLRTRDHRRRTVIQCIVIASLASFVVGVIMTAASFGPVFYPPGLLPPVTILVFQVQAKSSDLSAVDKSFLFLLLSQVSCRFEATSTAARNTLLYRPRCLCPSLLIDRLPLGNLAQIVFEASVHDLDASDYVTF